MQGPEQFVIEGSNDNKNWERIDEISQLVWKKGETKRIFIEENSKNYVYYKFNFTRTEKNDFLSIVNMELYGNYVVDVKDNSINEIDTSLWEESK